MSDGVSGGCEFEAFAHIEPQALAEATVAGQHKTHDDACCVAMWIGAARERWDGSPTSGRG